MFIYNSILLDNFFCFARISFFMILEPPNHFLNMLIRALNYTVLVYVTVTVISIYNLLNLY